MDERWNTRQRQLLPQLVASRTRDNEQVVIALPCLRLKPDWQIPKGFPVRCRDYSSSPIPRFQFFEFYSEHSRMDLVQTAIVSGDLGCIVFLLAIVPQHSHALRERGIGRDDHSGVTVGSQILGGIKAERSR